MDIIALEKVYDALNEAKAQIERVRGPSERCEQSFEALLHHINIVEDELDSIINPVAIGYRREKKPLVAYRQNA